MERQLEVQYSQKELEQEFVGLRSEGVPGVGVQKEERPPSSPSLPLWERWGATGLKCFSSLGALFLGKVHNWGTVVHGSVEQHLE